MNRNVDLGMPPNPHENGAHNIEFRGIEVQWLWSAVLKAWIDEHGNLMLPKTFAALSHTRYVCPCPTSKNIGA